MPVNSNLHVRGSAMRSRLCFEGYVRGGRKGVGSDTRRHDSEAGRQWFDEAEEETHEEEPRVGRPKGPAHAGPSFVGVWGELTDLANRADVETRLLAGTLYSRHASTPPALAASSRSAVPRSVPTRSSLRL